MSTRDTLNQIHEAQQKWVKQMLQPALQKFPLQHQNLSTISGPSIEPLSTPVDSPANVYLAHQEFPGQVPYTRGVQPTMYRGRLWTTRIFSGFGSPQETNQRYN
jgi:methylmalonyl-CoA mutase N-terminal domain/subunit